MSHSIDVSDWGKLFEYLSHNIHFSGSYLERVNSREFPKDAFSGGQLVSKAWMINTLRELAVPSDALTVAILGCWVGAAVDPLLREFNLRRIYGFDIDADTIALAEKFNHSWVSKDWRFKGVVADVSLMDMNHMVFQTSGELIELTPDWIINTSCEHMSTEWFDTIDSDQLVIMQTNDSEGYDGHINTCASVAEMSERYPMSHVLYAGEMITPLYKRFMQIGYR